MTELGAMFDLAQVRNNAAVLASGAATTLLLSSTAILLAAVLGLLLAILRSFSWRPLLWGSRTYVELIRGTPLLVQMYIVYYGLPSIGVTLSAFNSAAVALAFNSAAYVAEILRSAIQSVGKSQSESGICGRDEQIRHSSSNHFSASAADRSARTCW